MDLHATIQICNRYSNTKVVLVFTKDEEIHRGWIKDKFNVFTWLKDSIENLLAVKIGKKSTTFSSESMISKAMFIKKIIHDVCIIQNHCKVSPAKIRFFEVLVLHVHTSLVLLVF